MISFASDEMIRETMKYPEVFFMDCTARVNKQKREFVFSVIRTPSGMSPIKYDYYSIRFVR